MKKITFLITAFLAFNVSFAQNDITEEISMIQEIFGAEKKSII